MAPKPNSQAGITNSVQADTSQIYSRAGNYNVWGYNKGLSDVEANLAQTDKGLDSSLGDALWMLGGSHTDDSALSKGSVKPSKAPLRDNEYMS